jgi:cytochrome c553
MRLFRSVLLLTAAPVVFAANAPVATPVEQELERTFTSTVHPFVQTYCITCHGSDKPEAELDLSPYATMERVTAGFGFWEHVLERLEAGDMPPEKAKKHPTEAQSHEIVAWIKRLKKNEAEKNAGDPGIVLARRLSNAEYDYTIRELTGQDLRPTREFPVDPANQAGFANTGESLTMSPALWKKYYDAARSVAETVVFQPEGFTFAPHPMLVDTDRDKYSVLRIVDFYLRQPTDYAEYFLAAWHYRHRAALGRPNATLADVAAETKVSPKYLPLVWEVLNDPKEQVGPIAKLQRLWRELPAPRDTDPAALRARTQQMREWVLNLRDQIAPDVRNISGGGFGGGSQPMVLWKDRQMAANRRTYDPAKLRTGTPVPVEDVVARVFTAEDMPASHLAAAHTPVLAAAQRSVAKVNEPPKPGQKLAANLGLPTGPVITTDATGRKLSTIEIAELHEKTQPSRKAGGPLPKTPDNVKFGGVFLEPPVKTTSSSVTALLARAKKRGATPDPDLVVPEDPAERARHEASFARFASAFPDAFFISERARVNQDAETEAQLEGRLLSAGLHSETGYFRDDTPLAELVLDDAAQRELQSLWDIFNFNAEVAPRMHLAFLGNGGARGLDGAIFRAENREAATSPLVQKFAELTLARLETNKPAEPMYGAIKEHLERTAADIQWFERARAASEPTHLKSLEAFAERAYRRPLLPAERRDLREFYERSRKENGLEHEDAIRDTIVRVLMSPHFCYRVDLEAADGVAASPVKVSATNLTVPAGAKPLTDYQLANRLSYFLWSTMPDAELLARAAAGELQRTDVLVAQVRRMLKDDRVRNFATEFGGHWLDFRRFDEHNSVDRERFPAFDNELRAAMFEEPVRFLAELMRRDGSVLDCLYADYTFVNAPLAKHYGVMGNFAADTWTRVERVHQVDRGGLLPMAVFLTANSPGLRTSPVKRGYWVVRRVLGERIPAPPANVPDLPNDEKNLGELTLAQTLAKHRDNAACAGCHARFDSFGLVLENFGPIGERRTQDSAGRAVDSRAEFPGGAVATGLTGLRDYIRTHREKDFVDNLARKLLAFGLSRSLLLSDEPLIEEMKAKLVAERHRLGALVEAIVTSPQFRTRRITEPAKMAVTSR